MQAEGSIVLPGGAGLVGQNLVARLVAAGHRRIVVLDKHRANLEILRCLQPVVQAECVDLAEAGDWTRHVRDAAAVVMLQAQIGGNQLEEFRRNNLDATRHVLDAIRADGGGTRLIHVSSSVVASVAQDFYSITKREQEAMVLQSGLPCLVLRPTLMFGWFDRKHLGWLARFMRRVPVFPVPGDGRYMRQPLYVGDFCSIILRGIEQRGLVGVHDISGHERIDYIDIIREIRRATGARTPIVHLPYWLFHALLRTWERFDSNPPFTTQQLAALVARDEFTVTDWPATFDVRRTDFRSAVEETFRHPRFSQVVLEF